MLPVCVNVAFFVDTVHAIGYILPESTHRLLHIHRQRTSPLPLPVKIIIIAKEP